MTPLTTSATSTAAAVVLDTLPHYRQPFQNSGWDTQSKTPHHSYTAVPGTAKEYNVYILRIWLSCQWREIPKHARIRRRPRSGVLVLRTRPLCYKSPIKQQWREREKSHSFAYVLTLYYVLIAVPTGLTGCPCTWIRTESRRRLDGLLIILW